LQKRLGTFALLASLAASCSSPAASRPEATYNPETGRLQTLTADANKNGKHDTVSYMDGTRIIRIELDLDENGKVERWDFYQPSGELEKVGFSRGNDGVMDAVAFYETGGVLVRMEISTKADGRFDRVEFYERGGLVRSEDDTNGDGRPDKWDAYRRLPAPETEPAYAVVSTTFDDSGAGRPDRRFIYGPGGSIERVEVDPDGDGRFERVSDAQRAAAR
jgi:hypothetical protein